ncbi:MAG: MarR family transcriptional regulator [Psychromonas sp.]
MAKQTHQHKFHLLLHSADLIHEHLRIELLALDITPQQARVIKALSRKECVSQIDLAREFDITAASMSTMTVRLITSGFIKTEKDPINAKRNLLSLTEKGSAILNDISLVWDSVDVYMEEMIGNDNLDTLTDLTTLLRNSLGGCKPGTKVE